MSNEFNKADEESFWRSAFLTALPELISIEMTENRLLDATDKAHDIADHSLYLYKRRKGDYNSEPQTLSTSDSYTEGTR